MAADASRVIAAGERVPGEVTAAAMRLILSMK
jgi:hypothetical protein